MQVLNKSNANAHQTDMARMKYLVIATDPATGERSAFTPIGFKPTITSTRMPIWS